MSDSLGQGPQIGSKGAKRAEIDCLLQGRKKSKGAKKRPRWPYLQNAGLPDCNPWLQILKISNPLALFVTKNFLRRLQTEICNPCNYLL